MSCVYWIHLKEHTDITQQGYVGISNSFESRLKGHIKTTAKMKAIKGGWKIEDKPIGIIPN